MARCILYPNTTVILTAPQKNQSRNFIASIEKFIRVSRNLDNEIKDYKAGTNESYVKFKNGSEIIAMTFSEGALGRRGQMLIVDEYVRTDKEVVDRVFKPMLTSPRHPPYRALSKAEREKIGEEPQRQLFLSSIRSADEWSYKEFEDYIDKMTDGNDLYFTIALPYQFGVKAGYISRQTVVQQFETAQGNIDLLKAEKILPIFSNKY